MPHKIGAYVRVSTEEQAQVMDGSLESQQYRLKSFIDLKSHHEAGWGKIVETYIDDGYSAKDTNRPAYQRMMKDIRAGKVNLILVTDISRLSRSIHDFCILLKELDEHKAKFLSVKEQFDTSTPAGEMMIYNMVNLAQFERRQTSERVAMNFHSRAMRGLLNGGSPVLGYDKDPTNPGKLIVNKDEVPMVRTIFETYLETGSIQATAIRLNGTGILPKIGKGRKYRHIASGRWTVPTVRSHLTNLGYAGKREVNRNYKNEDQDYLKSWQRYQVVSASWPRIIDEESFLIVQKMLEENRLKERDRFKNGERRFFLLSGIIRCGDCGRALIGQAATGRSQTHRYYGHRQVVGEAIVCKHKRFRADEIETAVVEHLDEILLRAGHLDSVEENIRKIYGTQSTDLFSERDRVLKDLVALEKDIDSAFKLHADMDKEPEVLALVQGKLTALAEKKRKLVSYKEILLAKIDKHNDAKDARSVIEDRALAFKKGWPKASVATKKRLMRRLVDGLIYTTDGLQVFYVTSKDAPTELTATKTKMASEIDSGATSVTLQLLSPNSRRPSRFFSANGSPVVLNGGDAGS